MLVVVLGAAGKLGRRLVESCLAQGHEVTAAVRRPERYERTAHPRLRVVACEATDPTSLDAALSGAEALASAAGNIADGQRFVALFDAVTSAAERKLGPERRVWMLAGAGVLDVPGLGRIGLDLPFAPARYRPHLENWRRLERSNLDWALMCPGSMIPGDEKPGGLRTTRGALPLVLGGWTRFAPGLAVALAVKRRLPDLVVPYRGVADVVAAHLEPGGPFRRQRVGVGGDA